MPTAVVKLTPFLADQQFFGLPVPDWWAWVCTVAGLDAEMVFDDADVQGAVRIDGRFLSLDPHDLADLDEHDGVLTNHPPEEAVIAAGRTSQARLGRRVAGRRRLMTSEDPIAVSDLATLQAAELNVRWRTLESARARGVRVIDPSRTYVSPTVVLEPGCTLWPDVVLLGATRIGAGAVVHAGCHLTDTQVGSSAVLKPYTVAEGAEIGSDVAVGPFAHLRPGTVLAEGSRIGNFVETKNARIGSGSKANHLAYLGDVVVGEDVNFSAGAITCNYDGARKHATEIGDGAFIGTNSSLVAPLRIGAGALIAAGSVVTSDVPDHALAVERAKLLLKPDAGATILSRNRAAAAAARASSLQPAAPRRPRLIPARSTEPAIAEPPAAEPAAVEPALAEAPAAAEKPADTATPQAAAGEAPAPVAPPIEAATQLPSPIAAIGPETLDPAPDSFMAELLRPSWMQNSAPDDDALAPGTLVPLGLSDLAEEEEPG